jgi:hypothetical protein
MSFRNLLREIEELKAEVEHLAKDRDTWRERAIRAEAELKRVRPMVRKPR